APDVPSFSFPTGLKEGQRGSAMCTIKSGERPFEFQWLKNGEEIITSSNVKIQNVLDTSFLVIEAVSSESNGNYTCIVKNLYGSDRFTATLNVAAAPTWIKEPSDVLVEEGDSISIECAASGEPKPSVKWLRGEGNILISNDISSAMSVSASGTLTVNKIEAEMQGSYTCIAENEIGKPISKAIIILVRVILFIIALCYLFQIILCGDAPVVAPFIFPPALKEGERGSAICTIKSGDRPFEFHWEKDGKDLTNVETQSIRDSSILIIESVSSESSGNYTCIVSNAFGKDRFTASLLVTAPPVWKKEPMDQIVQEGESLAVECEAIGVPSPTMKWTVGDKHEPIPSDPSSIIRSSITGSLIINRVDISMGRIYSCEADNGFGHTLKKDIVITVRGNVKELRCNMIQQILSAFYVWILLFKGVLMGDAPVVASFAFPSALQEGERGSATCTIRSGDRPLEFQWKKDGMLLSQSSSVDIQYIKDSSFLVIESVTSKSSGNYTCIVKNSFGQDQFTASLTVTGETKNIVSTDASSVIHSSDSGSLVITKLDSSMKGSYVCEANNGYGEPLRKEIIVSVRDAPVISPFIFPPALKEGERASVQCTIRSGDKPIEFHWKKDGQGIDGYTNVEVQTHRDHSIMVIETVSAKSSGNYTCVVSNAYGKDQFTASLTVTAAPEWLNEPMDTVAEEGDSLTIECRATGVPQPSIKWTSGDGKILIPDDQVSSIRASSLGALVISKVEASMKGSYTCEANNGYGEPLRKTVLITVRGNYTCIVKNAFGSDRYTASLAVSAQPTWLREPLDVISKEGNGRVKNSSELFPNLMFDGSGTLMISKLDISMKGSYTCIADNGIGKSLQKTILISVQGIICRV
ncbi:hypothetical protein JTE90_011412, partial [Oedothorax gibbosus]